MNAIKRKRLDIGLKQNAVAKRLGISNRHYQRFENEDYPVDDERRQKLAEIFGCSVAEISQKEV